MGLLSSWADRKREITRATKAMKHNSSKPNNDMIKDGYSTLLRAVENRFGASRARVAASEIWNTKGFHRQSVFDPKCLELILDRYENPPQIGKLAATVRPSSPPPQYNPRQRIVRLRPPGYRPPLL